MKTKLTLVDRGVIAKAKRFARKQGTRLSALVEQQFNQLDAKSFGQKWRGKFKLPKKDPDDPRLNYLLKKYVYHTK